MQGRRRLGMLQERRGQAAQHRQGRLQPRLGDGTDANFQQPPAAARLIAEPGLVRLSRPGVQRQTTARSRRRGERLKDFRLNPLARQGLDDQVALPVEVRVSQPMLQGAAAAVAEVGTRGRGSLVAGGDDLKHFAPIPLDAGPHRLAGKHAGHIDRTRGDAVALGPHPLDDEDHLGAPARPKIASTLAHANACEGR